MLNEMTPHLDVRQSAVHGRGVFAVGSFAEGDILIDYAGEVISMQEAIRRHPHDPNEPDHTFYFHINDEHVIDGLYGGNASRWINHSCRPNCEPDEVGGGIVIKALRFIWPGEELTFDYDLFSDEPMTDTLKARYACRCGAKKCRGTMLGVTA